MIHQSFLSSSTWVVTSDLCTRGLSRSKPEWSRAALLRVAPTNSLRKLLQQYQNCNVMYGKVAVELCTNWLSNIFGGRKKKNKQIQFVWLSWQPAGAQDVPWAAGTSTYCPHGAWGSPDHGRDAGAPSILTSAVCFSFQIPSVVC